jgi:pimeloyl-ACP methyl ester carboxylesterase
VAISRQARRRVAPTPDPRLAKITIKGLVDHFEKQIRDLPEQPVPIGHSFGGLIVQMLLDRGLGAAGAAIDAGPPRGVLPSATAIGAALPVLLMWRGWSDITSMSFKSFSRRSPIRCRTASSAAPTTAISCRHAAASISRRRWVSAMPSFCEPAAPAAAAHCGERGPHEHPVDGQCNVPPTLSCAEPNGHP